MEVFVQYMLIIAMMVMIYRMCKCLDTRCVKWLDCLKRAGMTLKSKTTEGVFTFLTGNGHKGQLVVAKLKSGQKQKGRIYSGRLVPSAGKHNLLFPCWRRLQLISECMRKTFAGAGLQHTFIDTFCEQMQDPALGLPSLMFDKQMLRGDQRAEGNCGGLLGKDFLDKKDRDREYNSRTRLFELPADKSDSALKDWGLLVCVKLEEDYGRVRDATDRARKNTKKR